MLFDCTDIMNKELFFQVWAIYQDHWGKENREKRIIVSGREKLRNIVVNSVNIRHIFFLHEHFETQLRVDIDTSMKYIGDFIDACLGDEYDFFKKGDRYNPLKRNCLHPSVHHYDSLGRPFISFVGSPNESLRRVYSIVAYDKKK